MKSHSDSKHLVHIPFTSWTLPLPIATAYLLSVLYNVVFFTQFTSTPYIVKALGISDTSYGYVQTLFGVLQMVGGPIFGFITHRFGIRASLLLCYGSTLLSSLLLYSAVDLSTLVLSLLPVLFMHGQQGIQTLLASITEPGKERTSAFGRMGLTFGIGFVCAPMLSMLSRKLISDQAPLLVSATLCLLPIAIVLTRIHDPEKPAHEDSTAPSASLFSRFPVLLDVLSRRSVLNLLLKKNIVIFPILLTFAILPLYLIERFEATPETNATFQMLTGLCIMFNNGFGVVYLRRRFPEQRLLLIGCTSFLAFLASLWQMFFIMPFISLGMSLVATVADSLLTCTGLILGFATALNSFVRTFAPAISGRMLETRGFSFFGQLGTLCSLGGIALCHFLPVPQHQLRSSHHEDKKDS